MHTHVHTHIHTNTRTHTHTHTRTYARTYAHTCTHTHAPTNARSHPPTHTHTHTHTHTKHMVIDGQVFFHGWLFADLKLCRCITGPAEPKNSINKDMCGAKLLLTNVSAYPVDCVCFCDLLKTQHCCLSSNGRYNPPLAAHPPPPPTSL